MKKERLKRIISLSLIFVLTCLTVCYATNEVEPNDKTKDATHVYVNTPFTGSIEEYWDYDYYYFELSSPGAVTINFQHTKLKSANSTWQVTLYSEDDRFIISRGIKGNDEDFSFPIMGLDAGTYYIEVEDGSDFDSTPYTVTIQFEQSDNWEKEKNDKTSTSTPINLNEHYYGSSMEAFDSDYYYLEVPSNGVLTVNFKHAKLKSADSTWKVTLYNEDGDSIVYKFISGNKANVSLPAMGVESGTYYIGIDTTFDSDPTVYTLTANFKKSNNWEKEPNGETGLSTSIKFNKKYYGTSKFDYDEDCYCLRNSKKKTVTVTFSHAKLKTSKDIWVVYLLDSKGNVKKKAYVKGNKKTTTLKCKMKKGTFYIDVYAPYGSNPTKYSIKVK